VSACKRAPAKVIRLVKSVHGNLFFGFVLAGLFFNYYLEYFMRPSHRIVAAIMLSLVSFLAHAADKPASMKLCYEKEDIHPGVLKAKPALKIVLIGAIEKKLGIKFELAALPWKRCLDELKAGSFDGIVAASFKPDRLELGTFPMVAGKPDETKAMMFGGYTLYRLKGSNLAQWDGKTLAVKGSIGAQPGYSIIDQIKGLGGKVDDGTRTAEDNLRKLLAGRVAAVALQTLEGENLVNNNPEFSGKIEKVSPALVNKPSYLMLSKQFVAKHGDFSKTVWNAAEQVRESAEFKASAGSFK
jgi:polar amino acid transport system substrate-binding protein